MASIWDTFDAAPKAVSMWEDFDREHGDSGARRVGDLGVDLAKGVVGLGESAIGIADMISFGAAGHVMESLGYDPKRTRGMLSELYSSQRQVANKSVEGAEGFLDTAYELLANPSVLAGAVVEATPGTLGIAAMGRTVALRSFNVAQAAALAAGLGREAAKEAGIAAVQRALPRILSVAGAAEGAQAAGSIAEQARQEGREWADYVLPAAGAGALTALITKGSGTLGAKVGLGGDLETSIAAGAAARPAEGGIISRTMKGALREGVLEELPQSAQEQVFQNVAMGEQDALKGVAGQAATGMLVGGAMGGGHAALTGKRPAEEAERDTREELRAGERAAARAAADIMAAPSADAAIATALAGSEGTPVRVPGIVSGAQGERPRTAMELAFERAGVKRDREDLEGLPGQVGVGPQPVEGQPLPGAGEEAAAPGGALQAPGAGQPGAAVSQQDIDREVDRLAAERHERGENFADLDALEDEARANLGVRTELDARAHEAASSPLNDRPEPTPAQAEAGNYKKGHLDVWGMDISIENPAGSVRRDTKNDPPRWEVEQKDHYGYVRGTTGFDKDHLDAFIKPGTGYGFGGTVYIVNQGKDDGSFDEHKALIGYGSQDEAREAYLRNYDNRRLAESRVRSIVAMPMDDFKNWAFSSTSGPATGELKLPTTHYIDDRLLVRALGKGEQPPAGAQTFTDFEAARSARIAALKRQAQGKKKIDVDRDSLIPAIIKLGGISMEDRPDVIGEGNRSISGVGHLFTKAGTGLDDMARLLVQHGYMTQAEIDDAKDTGGTRLLAQRIKAEFDRGEQHFSVAGQARELSEREQAENEEAYERYKQEQGLDDETALGGLADTLAADEELAAGWSTLTPEEQDAQLDALFGSEEVAAEGEGPGAPAATAEARPAREREPGEDDEPEADAVARLGPSLAGAGDLARDLQATIAEVRATQAEFLQSKGYERASDVPVEARPAFQAEYERWLAKRMPKASRGGDRKEIAKRTGGLFDEPSAQPAEEAKNVGGSLFIPLKTEFFDAFQAGTKDTEYRRYGGQWTEKHVYPGRRVILSKGYGKGQRVEGVVVEAKRGAPPDDPAWKQIYGDAQDAFHIKIRVLRDKAPDSAVQNRQEPAAEREGDLVRQTGFTPYPYPPAGEADHPVRKIVHGIKENDRAAIAKAAAEMARAVGPDDVLIAVPGRQVNAENGVFFLTKEIARISGAADVSGALRTKGPRQGQYERKKKGLPPLKGKELKMEWLGNALVDGRTGMGAPLDVEPRAKVWIVDNVIGSGETMKAAIEAVGRGEPLVYAREGAAPASAQKPAAQQKPALVKGERLTEFKVGTRIINDRGQAGTIKEVGAGDFFVDVEWDSRMPSTGAPIVSRILRPRKNDLQDWERLYSVTEGPAPQPPAKTREEAETRHAGPKVTPIDPAGPIPNPVNGEELYAEPDRTLICMACSLTKIATDKPVPIVELYDGPLWQTLRKHAGKVDLRGNLLILSGKHLWVGAGRMTEPYNERISSQKVDELIRRGVTYVSPPRQRGDTDLKIHSSPVQILSSETKYGRKPYRNVIIVGSNDYERAFHAAVTQLREYGYIAQDAAIVQTAGGIGEQRQQLREALEDVNGLNQDDIRDYGRDRSIPEGEDFKLGDQHPAAAPPRTPMTGDEPPLLATPEGTAPPRELPPQPTQQADMFGAAAAALREAADKIERAAAGEQAPPAAPAEEIAAPTDPLAGVEADIPRGVAVSAFNNTSHSPEERGESRIKWYVAALREDYAELAKKADTDEKRATLDRMFADYRAGYKARILAYLHAHGRVASAFIVGPANFPVERNRKRSDTADRRLQEASDYRKRALARIVGEIAPVESSTISSDDPEAVAKLTEKVAAAERLQEAMKAGNRIIREKISDDEKVAKMMALGLSERTARAAIKPDVMGSLGFPDYRLKNNNAEIRRLKGRIEQLQVRAGDETFRQQFEGFEVVDNVQANRLQVIFPGKPDAAIREKLKANGFRWAPSEGAWQRFRGPAGEMGLERALGVRLQRPKASRGGRTHAANQAAIDAALAIMDEAESSGAFSDIRWRIEVPGEDALYSITRPAVVIENIEAARPRSGAARALLQQLREARVDVIPEEISEEAMAFWEKMAGEGLALGRFFMDEPKASRGGAMSPSDLPDQVTGDPSAIEWHETSVGFYATVNGRRVTIYKPTAARSSYFAVVSGSSGQLRNGGAAATFEEAASIALDGTSLQPVAEAARGPKPRAPIDLGIEWEQEAPGEPVLGYLADERVVTITRIEGNRFELDFEGGEVIEATLSSFARARARAERILADRMAGESPQPSRGGGGTEASLAHAIAALDSIIPWYEARGAAAAEHVRLLKQKREEIAGQFERPGEIYYEPRIPIDVSLMEAFKRNQRLHAVGKMLESPFFEGDERWPERWFNRLFDRHGEKWIAQAREALDEVEAQARTSGAAAGLSQFDVRFGDAAETQRARFAWVAAARAALAKYERAPKASRGRPTPEDGDSYYFGVAPEANIAPPPRTLAGLAREVEIMEQLVDDAYERDSANAEDLDAALAEMREELASAVEQYDAEDEPSADVEVDQDFDYSTFEEELRQARADMVAGRIDRAEALERVRGAIVERGGKTAERMAPAEVVARGQVLPPRMVLDAAATDQEILDAMEDAYAASVARKVRRMVRRDGVIFQDTDKGPVVVARDVALVEPRQWHGALQVAGRTLYESNIVDVATRKSVGRISFTWRDGKALELLSLWFPMNERGKGYGEKAFRALLEANAGAPIQVLDILNDAVGFWRKMGVEFYKGPEGEDHGTATLESLNSSRGRARGPQAGRAAAEGSVPPGPRARRQGARQAQGLSRRQLETRLVQAFGQGVRKLFRSNLLRYTATAAGLPARLQTYYGPGTEALYDPAGRGAIWLIGSELALERAVPVLMHELGEHYGLERMLGATGYRNLQNAVRGSRQNAAIGAAWDYVTRRYPELEEGGEEFVSEVLARAAESEEALKLPFFQRLIAAVREFLVRLGLQAGLIRRVSDRDIVLLVAASARRAIAGAEPRAHHVPRETVQAAGREDRDGAAATRARDLQPPAAVPGAARGGFLGKIFGKAPEAILKAKPGASFRRLNRLLGAKLYGDAVDLAPVSVKEMVQNSFDAIKALIDQGAISKGELRINVDAKRRTISVQDNGAGMTPETLATSFVQIAGTKKETSRSSGGLGIAKGLFIYGNERIRVETVRDGKLATMDTSGEELMDAADGGGAAPEVTVVQTDRPSGTKVTVTLPREVVERDGGKASVPMPVHASHYPVLKYSPLFSNIAVTFNGIPVETMGEAFQRDKYSVFAHAKFPWGRATLYVSKFEEAINWPYNNMHVLSNGLWQFSGFVPADPLDPYKRGVPRNIFIDVHADVEPDEPGYPFDLNRQRFSDKAQSDLSAIQRYLAIAYQHEVTEAAANNYGRIRYLVKGERGAPEMLAPPVVAGKDKLLRIVEGDEVEVREGALIVNGRKVPVLTDTDLRTLRVNLRDYRIDQKQIKADQVMLHDAAMLHGELFSERMAKELDGFDAFIEQLGRHFIELRDLVVSLRGNKYLGLKPYAIGISFDKRYHGVHVNVPFSGVFVNPATMRGVRTEVAGNEIFGTMMHELVHHRENGHGEAYVNELQRMYSEILADPNGAALRHKVVKLVTDNAELFTAFNEAFSHEDLQAVGKSLQGDEQGRATRAPAGAREAVERGAQGEDERGGDAARGLTERGELPREGEAARDVKASRGADQGRRRFVLGLGALTASQIAPAARAEAPQFTVRSGAMADEPMRWIAQNSENPLRREVARRIAPLLEDVPVRVIDPGIWYSDPFPGVLRYANGATQVGSRGIKIFLRSDRGLNEQTALHEGVHGATMAVVQAKPNAEPVKRLQALLERVRAATEKHPERQNFKHALENVDELVAWGLTEPRFQAVLKEIRVPGEPTAWGRLVDLIARIIGIGDAVAGTRSALEDVIDASFQLIDEAGKPRGWLFGALEDSVRASRGGADNPQADMFGRPDRGRRIDLTTVEGRNAIADRAKSWIGAALNSERTFNWWHRSVGTQYHKAMVSAPFRRVFVEGQAQITDTNRFSLQAEEKAPDILLRLEAPKELLKRPAKPADLKAAATALFKGTLWGGPSPLSGKVFTDEELRAELGLNDWQIGLYRQSRAAVDESVETMGKSVVARLLRTYEVEIDPEMTLDDIATLATEALNERRDELQLALEQVGEEIPDTPAPEETLLGWEVRQRDRAANQVLSKRQKLMQELDAVEQAIQKVKEINDRVRGLQRAGYFPLMRFGRYWVNVKDVDEKGAPQERFFGMYETEAERNAAADALRKEFPGAVITRGIHSEDAWRLFKGISPETIELFADIAGLDEHPLMQKFIQLAMSERSALKRLLERKGTPGWSWDLPRVLAQFITSNARTASGNYHHATMLNAIDDIPEHQGDVKDEAVRLYSYLTDPQEEAAKLRGYLFFHFLGGSLAAGFVNMTQPVMVSAPYLSQYAGAGKVAKELGRAMAEAAKSGLPGDAAGQAMQRAIEDGVVAPHEIYQLMAEARGGIGRSIALRQLTRIWGGLFSLAEAWNRRSTFLAAYRIAEGNREADPYAFAVRAVHETQFIYNKGNRPNWARGPVGATVFTFKQFSISYLEFLKRLPLRQRLLALGVLVLAAGLEGLPGADDLDDLLDTFGQWMGFATNTKKWRRQAIEGMIGKEAGQFVLHGVSAMPGFPLDVQARLGVGNLIPGTSIFKPSTIADKGREISEVLGPVGGLGKSAFDVARAAFQGDAAEAAKAGLPVALRNAYYGMEMFQTGEYRDMRGRRVVDTNAMDAFVKAVGFQPSRVARESRKVSEAMTDVNLQRSKEEAIAEKMARAVLEKKPELRAEALEEQREWNARNPELRIQIRTSQIMQRVRDARRTREERFVRRAAPEIRREIREGLRE